jgi:transcriptional regulator with XRE-family HTH domain
MSRGFCVIFYEFYSKEEIGMIYERIKALCNKNKISVNALEFELGIAKGSLCKIDNHKPSSEKMQAIASKLLTTVDYLMTGKEFEFSPEMAMIDIKLSNMSLELKEYALKLAELSEEKQRQIMNLIDMLE